MGTRSGVTGALEPGSNAPLSRDETLGALHDPPVDLHVEEAGPG